MRRWGSLPGKLVASVGDGLLDLLLGGLGGVGDNTLLDLVAPIFAAGVRHVDVWWWGGWGWWFVV